MITELLKVLARRAEPEIDDIDFRPLARHSHFSTYAALVPDVPPEGPAAVRSWFGGMPEMPETTDWPRDEDGKPYLFLAQICCADLPQALWGGIGPRDGWLLVFAHPERNGPDLRVMHVADRGPARHEGAAIKRPYWTWYGNDAKLLDGPVFRRFPVRPVAMTTPADVSLPKATPANVPALQPQTWGELKPLLDRIDRDHALPKPAARKTDAQTRHRLAEIERRMAQESDDRRALRKEVEDQGTIALEEMSEIRMARREEIDAWRAVIEAEDAEDPLAAEDWAAFLSWVTGTQRRQLVLKQRAPAIPAVVSRSMASFTPLWRSVGTKAEFREQMARLSKFWNQVDPVRDYQNLKQRRNHAKHRPESWSDALEVRWQQLQEPHAALANEQERLKPFLDVMREVNRSLIDCGDEEPVDPDLMEKFVTVARSVPRYADWITETSPEIPAIQGWVIEETGPLLPGLTEAGLTPDKKTGDLYKALATALLDRFFQGDTDADMTAKARAYAEHAAQSGRTMGGLPFFGHERIDPMELHAYGSAAYRTKLDTDEGRAIYGDIRRKEPQCLLLNLGSYDPVGWLWGDTYTLTIHMPRADLAAMRFDRVTGYIDNG